MRPRKLGLAILAICQVDFAINLPVEKKKKIGPGIFFSCQLVDIKFNMNQMIMSVK